MVSSGQSALKALLTMNGGATIAFLTFIGHLWDKSTMPPTSVDLFVEALQLFIYGTFVTVFAYSMIFVTNCLSYRYSKTFVTQRPSYRNYKNWSDLMFGVTTICGATALVFFLLASWRAVEAFQSVSKVLKP